MCDYLKEAQLWAARKQEAADALNRSGLPLVLFGKSPAVNSEFLDQLRVPVRFICDNNPDKWGSTLWGLEVISPAKLQDFYSAYNVLILVPFEDQIAPQLQNLPVPPESIYRLDLYFEEENSADYFRDAQGDFERIYNKLSDQASKRTYESVIRYRVNRDPAYLREIALPRRTQYFPDTLDGTPFLSPNEVFVDAGAFIGDTVESFLAATKGSYRAIYALEPEVENFQTLMKAVGGRPNVFCTQAAVGAEEGQISFFSDDSGLKADKHGGETVNVKPLDSLLRDVPVTFLKMDVEGMECAALRGAKQIIRKNHPKLAVCTYHSNADMIEVPKLILELDPSYRLYFRHYTNALVETVCYAV